MPTPIKDRYISALIIVAALAIVGLVTYRLFLQPVNSTQYKTPTIAEKTNVNKLSQQSVDSYYLVKQVVDGDTLVLDNRDTVRLIGVDTPETNHPEIPVQRFGKEATEFTRRMVEGMKVTLELGDPAEDNYGRKLAYVFIDNVLLNKEIIRRGYGYAYRRFPHPRIDEFIAAEQEARAKQCGLWNYSLTDGRVTNLLSRYEQLNSEGKEKLEHVLDELLQEYPNRKTK